MITGAANFGTHIRCRIASNARAACAFPFSCLHGGFIVISVLRSSSSRATLRCKMSCAIGSLSISLAAPTRIKRRVVVCQRADASGVIA